MIRAARLLAFLTGFLSLSQEVLWVRLVGFAYRGTPQAFGFVLGLFLLGIALGAVIGKRYCKGRYDLFLVSGYVLVISGLADAILPWLSVGATGFGRLMGVMVFSLSIVVVAFLKSTVFPMAHHLGSSAQTDRLGGHLSRVYFSNIIGSTLGPLLTGFLLLEYVTLQNCFVLISVASLLAGSGYLFWKKSTLGKPALIISFALASLLFLMPQTLLRILIENTGRNEGPVARVIENRSGIIHVLSTPKGDDFVFGGNVYDGRINIDFLGDSNWISRLYAIATLKPEARRILVIGMSAGPWTRVLSSFPEASNIDVVEINPGYIGVTSDYPELRPLLSDTRVHIHIDDGRRWLNKNPSAQYDLILMNTTFHWRACATLILSKEFIQRVSDHMNQEAILAYNSTDSPDVFETAASVFPQVYRFGNFVIAGRKIEIPQFGEALKRLARLQIDGTHLIDISDARVVEKVGAIMTMFQPFAEMKKESQRPLEVITDDNMITEYKYGQSALSYFFRAQRDRH